MEPSVFSCAIYSLGFFVVVFGFSNLPQKAGLMISQHFSCHNFVLGGYKLRNIGISVAYVFYGSGKGVHKPYSVTSSLTRGIRVAHC